MNTVLAAPLTRLSEVERLHARCDFAGIVDFASGLAPEALVAEPVLACWFADALCRTGRGEEALELLGRVGPVVRWTGDHHAHRFWLHEVGAVHFLLGRLAPARAAWELLLELAGEAGALRMVALAHNNLGIVADLECRWSEALGHYQRAADGYRRIGGWLGLGWVHANRAFCYLQLGLPDRASSHLDQALACYGTAGDRMYTGIAETLRGRIALFRGDLELAECTARRAVASLRATSMTLHEGSALRLLGAVLGALGRLEEGEAALDQAAERARRCGARLLAAEIAEQRAALAALGGDPERAARCAEEARALYRAIGAEVRAERVVGAV